MDFDGRIRQELARLPDTPPPGSEFEPDKLWTQLRPQLTEAPARWRTVGWWWWAAACVVVILLICQMIWLGRFDSSQPSIAEKKLPKHQPAITKTTAASTSRQRQPVLADTKPANGHEPARIVAVPTPSAPDGRPVMPVDTVKVVAVTEMVLSTPIEKSNELPVTPVPTATPIPVSRPVVAATAPRRRFRVVHVSELAEFDQRRIIEPKLPQESLVQFRLPTANEAVETGESNWSYLRRTKNNHSLTN